MEYALHLLIVIGIYCIAVVGLGIPVGYTGLLSVAHAAFVGIGAYTTALLALRGGEVTLFTLLGAIAAAMCTGWIVSRLSSRTFGDYFAILTLAVQVLIFEILNNWNSVTRGPMGLPGIPAPRILGVLIDSKLEFIGLLTVGIAVAYVISNRFGSSDLGRALQVIKEDELLALSRGLQVNYLKSFSLVVAAAFAGAAGWLHAGYFSYVEPSGFNSSESITLLAMVVIGGRPGVGSAILGASAILALPELLRFVGFPADLAAHAKQITYGLALIALMIWRPLGILCEKGGAE